MADLFVLLRDLGDHIASKGDGSSSTQYDDDDPVESRFRSVLPNLLEGYLVPFKVKELELMAILKLLCHTVKHYPGVFFHGKGHTVLPILGRIIPLFAEPDLSGRHGGLFDTLCALLSLLRIGERETYCQIFIDAMVLVEDLVSIASFFSSPTSFTMCTTVSLQCYMKAYSGVDDGIEPGSMPAPFCGIPSCWTPLQGPGLLIDVTGETRWQPLAEWTLKLLVRYLSEGALQIEGLLTSSFVAAVGSLLSYGDSQLHKACFELVCTATTVMDAEAIPSEKLILSIISILSLNDGRIVPFRTADYDGALGGCLLALYTTGQSGTIQCTAQSLLDVLPQTVRHSSSWELKVAMCDIFVMIIKQCPSYSEHMCSLLQLAFIPEVVSPLSCCIQLAVETLGPNEVGGTATNFGGLFAQESSEVRQAPVDSICRRLDSPRHTWPLLLEPDFSDTAGSSQEDESSQSKRRRRNAQRTGLAVVQVDASISHSNINGPPQTSMKDVQTEGEPAVLGASSECIAGFLSSFRSEQQRSASAASIHEEVMQMTDTLQPLERVGAEISSVEGKLAALCVLVRVFAKFPKTICNQRLIQILHDWIPWMHDKGQGGTLTRMQLSMFLEAVEWLFSQHGGDNEGVRQFVQESAPDGEYSNLDLFCSVSSFDPVAVLEILSLPWSLLEVGEADSFWKTKSRAVGLAAKLGGKSQKLIFDGVVERALKDDDARVRATAVGVVPVLVQWSSPSRLHKFCEVIGGLGDDKAEQVREVVAQTLGALACICSSTNSVTEGSSLPAQLESVAGRRAGCFFGSLAEFACPLCDGGACNLASVDTSLQNCQEIAGYGDRDRKQLTPLATWQPLFAKLLFNEPSEHVQVALVSSMSRLLTHASADELTFTRGDWLTCLDALPLHQHRGVREAFCTQIHGFIKKHVLTGLLGSQDEGSSDTDRELEMLDKFRHALCGTEDPEMTETLLESVAEIAKAACRSQQLLFFSLVLLLEKLDNREVSLRVMSVSLIHKVASHGYPTGGTGSMQAMVDSIREELFEYLVGRLVGRPHMVREFAEAVLCIEMEELIKQMVPIVLPKLVLKQQDSQPALVALQELAKQLKTELPLLLLEWCHRVLSVLLLRADGKELMAALQFYEAQTGSEPREIFAAVLPALLDELVRFLGDIDNEDGLRRSARVAPMIQEVASIVTGSDDLPTFLRTHFVGLLNSIDRKLLRAVDIASQRQALRCIERLMDMIGPHLSAFVPKIMALLTQALQEPLLRGEGLKAWLSFVRTLAQVSPTNLKNVASQIVVSLMPCLERQSGEQTAPHLTAAVEILEELVVKNRSVLEDQAVELPLLPSLPALEGVNAILQEAHGLLSLRDQLRQATDGLRHESLSVRYMTASELNKVLRLKRKDIGAMLIGEASLDADVISCLITALMRGCAEESRTAMSQRLKIACAECLGELGAVDPVKLQVDLRCRSRIERSDDDLVFELINEHLAPVLRAASDTDIQDTAALAIQELLKFSGCRAAQLGRGALAWAGRTSGSRSGKMVASNLRSFEGRDCDKTILGAAARTNESGERLWQRFSDDVKEIITPCLTSKYLLKKSGAVMPTGPLLQPGMSFRRWMYLWIRRLVSQATGQRADIFTACRGVVRHDMGTALYLLPYLVLNVVCDGSEEARTGVTEEILNVLSETASTVAADEEICNSSRSWSGPSEVSTQTVFTLLDNLGKWLDDCKRGGSVAPSQAIPVNIPSRGTRGSTKVEEANQVARRIDNVSQLLAAIPKQALAGASFRCQAYARSLLYFESHVHEKSGALNPAAGTSGAFTDEDVTFLLEIYSGLEEPDGLSGLSRLCKPASLQDQILINEKAGNWGEALTCCEQALQMEPNSVTRHLGVLDCLLNMGHLQAMVIHVDGLISRMPNHTKEWSTRGLQAAWRLGQWDLLEEYVRGADGEGLLSNASDGNSAFDISLGKVLQALQKRDQDLFAEQLMYSRQTLLAPLAAASMESYTRAYPFVVKLHMLRELEDFSTLAFMDGEESGKAGEPHRVQPHVRMVQLVEDWESRLKITQPSLWTREPILALRRLVFSASNLQAEVGACWLQYAKLCRAAGHYETANRAILQAQSVGAPNAHMEMAKLLWDTQRSHRAIAELQQALTNVPQQVLGEATVSAIGGLLVTQSAAPRGAPGTSTNSASASRVVNSTQVRRDKDHDVAKTLLLLARWVHHTGQKQKKDVLSLYHQVRSLQPHWEKGFFFVAKYYDDLLVDARRRQEESLDGAKDSLQPGRHRRHPPVDDKPWWSYLPDALIFYAKGLHKGHRRLFQAMPRLLTLWFEFGTIYRGEALASNAGVKAVHTRTMGIMRGCLKDLPTYQWLTALSQLVSRICHQNEELVRLVKRIITTVLQVYPQQALWTMAAVSKSTVAARREAAAEIIQQAKRNDKEARQDRHKALFCQFAGLIDQMIKLSFYPGQPKARTVNIQSEFSGLKRMMPVGVIMPLQKALTVTLPADGLSNVDYNPFPTGDYATICGITDEVEILASLQRPKKVVLVGSDGAEHPFLCKPKDDLRKDARMMEFTTMINRLLSKDPQSRRRKLYIRTFAVIPLTEDCGMIEWVLHTRGLRHILQDIYVTTGKFDRQKTNPLIKRLYEQQGAQGEEILHTKLLHMFPPVFHRWFLNTFPEPAAWFRARVAYAHTTAVWSMVGHIVGLGDRHGENILFDSTTGDCVHVDFSCLFDKGLALEKPEVVPFRLTQDLQNMILRLLLQNMIDGLGITGYEGVFSRVCEITLSVLRAHRETLVSVLETFIHDPLVEWTKSHKSSEVEVQNPHAQRAIANIEARLQGVVVGVGAAPSLPLSVEGQAHRLIEEAVSRSNLAKMYIWVLQVSLDIDCLDFQNQSLTSTRRQLFRGLATAKDFLAPVDLPQLNTKHKESEATEHTAATE